jgi:hypothetical protein
MTTLIDQKTIAPVTLNEQQIGMFSTPLHDIHTGSK